MRPKPKFARLVALLLPWLAAALPSGCDSRRAFVSAPGTPSRTAGSRVESAAPSTPDPGKSSARMPAPATVASSAVDPAPAALPFCPPQDARMVYSSLFHWGGSATFWAWDGAACRVARSGSCRGCAGRDCSRVFRTQTACETAHAGCAR